MRPSSFSVRSVAKMSRTTDGRQPHRRLVQKQHARLGHQRPPDGQHLLLAARKSARLLRLTLLEPGEEGEDLLQPLGHREAPPPSRIRPESQVLRHREWSEQLPALRDLHEATGDDLLHTQGVQAARRRG